MVATGSRTYCPSTAAPARPGGRDVPLMTHGHRPARIVADRRRRDPDAARPRTDGRVSVQAFRRQGRRFGAGLVCSEMVSCAGIEHRNERTLGYLRVAADEHPLAIQLFGSDPATMGEAARMVGRGRRHRRRQLRLPGEEGDEDGRRRDPAGGCGPRLPHRRGRRQAVDLPVTVKMRRGLRDGSRACLEVGPATRRRRRRIADAASALRRADVHGPADHALTAELVSLVDVPVVASGDITSRARAQSRACRDRRSGGDGRARRQGNPWALREILEGDGSADARGGRRGARPVRPRDGARARRAPSVGFLKKFYGWYLGRGRFPKPFKQELLQLDSHRGDRAAALRRRARRDPTRRAARGRDPDR